jgi:hypothetical protein
MIEIEKARIECAEMSPDNTFGKFVVEPLERGFGNTLGNALRRVLLAPCRERRSPHPYSKASSTSSPPSGSWKTLRSSSELNAACHQDFKDQPQDLLHGRKGPLRADGRGHPLGSVMEW